jgi:hypothetical protein
LKTKAIAGNGGKARGSIIKRAFRIADECNIFAIAEIEVLELGRSLPYAARL